MMKLSAPTLEQCKILTRWRVSTFWVMLIGYIGYYICRANLSAALPLLSQTFHYSNTELGIILTFSELAYALGKFTTGPVADKLGGKRIFIVGMVGAIVFNLIFPFFSSITMFTIVWCFCRYFLSMGWGGIVKVIGEWYEPEKNGTVMGLISINFQFGSVVASLICGELIVLGSGWKGLFVFPAVFTILIAIWSGLASREKPQDVVPNVRFGKTAGTKRSIASYDHAEKMHSARYILGTLSKIPQFRQILVFSFFIHILRSIFMFWTPKLLVDIGMGNANAVMASAIFPFLGCIGTIFLGWYTDHHAKNGDRARMMTVMLGGLVLTLLAIAWLIQFKLEYQTTVVVLLGLAGFFMYGPYSMSAGCMALDVAGTHGAGTFTGMVDGVGYIGGALAAWGAGILSDRLGWSDVMLLLAGVALFVTAWTFYMSHFHRKRVE